MSAARPSGATTGTRDVVRAGPRQVAALIWDASRTLTVLVVLLVVANAITPAAVVVALGEVVARIPAAVEHGMDGVAGEQLLAALGIAALVYGFSLVLGPVGGALSTAARTRITGRLQARLLTAVSAPVGIGHLEDGEVLDRLARAEGSLTGYLPGDAPVTWAGTFATRLSGIVGCAVVTWYVWWLGPTLLVLWLVVRHVMLRAVIRQSTDLRSQTATLRRAWYLAGVGTKARDAKEVRVFGLASFLSARFGDEYRSTLEKGADGLRGLHRRAALGFAAVVAGYALALAVIAHDTLVGSLELNGLVVLLPMLAVTMSTGSVSMDDITLTWALASLPDVDRLELDLRADPVAAETPGLAAPRPDRPRPAAVDPRSETDAAGGDPIVFDDVAFRYPASDRDVLHGLDLRLDAGASTAIVGANGAGKSTLIGLLARLHDPVSGVIRSGDVDLRRIDPVVWQRRVALMPQDPIRFPASAYDNIAFGAIEHRDDRDGVRAAAELAGFAEIVPRLPHGWDTVLSRELGGVDLSGGQWQRLALARALFATQHGARVLVLDEPTSALDIRSEAAFYGRFLEITRELTTVVISHRFATVRRADRICVLDGGRITESGTHDELVAAGGVYARMYAAQARRFGGAA